jgi:drug/metabolite transporter (DMT)-like permease
VHPPVEASAGQIAILAAGGVLGAAAYLTLYRSLELGPIALCSPIVAAYAAITILLAVTLSGERMTGLASLGTLLSLVGVVFASADPRGLQPGRRILLGGGVPWAITSMILFGVATYVLGRVSHDIGWAAPTFWSRIADVLVIVVVVVLMRRHLGGARPRARDVALACVVGFADMAGVVAYARGTELGYVSIVTAASVAFILIPVFGGLAFFHERPARSQVLGVVLVAGGLVLLGMGQ